MAHRAAARQPGVRRSGVRARDRYGRSWPVDVAQLRCQPKTSRRRSLRPAHRPRIAILREQGVNSQTEMAYAFYRAGFASVDVHMTDLIEGRQSLRDFKGLVACGGFSYGDVLGAGGGWAKTILHNPKLAEMFVAFFSRDDSFALGVCNGCQMMSRLKALIPGAQHWPRFERNASEQYEGRLVQVEVLPSPSLFFAGMAGSIVPIANAHGEGRAVFDSAAGTERRQRCDALRRLAASCDRCVPLQPQWLAGRPMRVHHGRRPLHDRDAASGARVPHRADVMATAAAW